MSTLRDKARTPHLDRPSQERISVLLRAVYLRPEASPVPDEQVDLLLALRRKERDRQRQG